MEMTKIRSEPRQPGNRHANERLRRQGLVPAVIYGHQETPEAVSLSRHDLDLALQHATHVVRLAVGGQERPYLIKEVQYDHLQKDPLHVDLMRVDEHERVKVRVPVALKGVPKGVLAGGELVQVLADVEVECPLLAIPEAVYCNVKDIEIDQMLHIREMEFPADVKPLHDADDIVLLVRVKKAEEGPAAPAEAAAEAAAAEPEVIGKKAKEEEAAGEEKK